MLRIGKRAGLVALLTAALTASSVKALEPGTVPPDLKTIQKQLQNIETALQELRTMQVQVQNNSAGLHELRDRIQRVERSLADLSARQAEPRISRSYDPIQPGVRPQGGTIRLRNTSEVGATVVLNGQRYSVPAGDTVTLSNQPAGMFSYEVLADGHGLIKPTVSSNLRESELLTITIYPQRIIPIPVTVP